MLTIVKNLTTAKNFIRDKNETFVDIVIIQSKAILSHCLTSELKNGKSKL